jgi:hypothetical protein
MKRLFLPLLPLAALAGCSKALDAVADNVQNEISNSTTAASNMQEYTIDPGAHYCNQNGMRAVDLSEQRFTVRFDSSAIYTSADPANQYDINKLWGFSDNGSYDHHQYSARFGWCWNNGALRLFGYVYNAGQVSWKELGTVALGSEHECSIRITPQQYIFTLNGHADSLARTSNTPTGKGYQLYPYFGGDEVAPHKVRIWIREK